MKTRKEEPAMLKRVRPVFIGTAAGMLCCLAVLLLFALLMAARDIPQSAVTPMAVAAAAMGAFIGGFISARIAGSRGLFYGAACGALMYLLILVAGISLLQSISGWYAVAKLLVIMVSAAIGGVYGVNRRRRR
ncbi:MAG TPA: TIGR04086 family membrane protein [Ruminococcaceae bacterium]|nr:TIGR04086 family membrane protein [Oscillospiraceae bacterium]HCA30281.1 TIGR04086 family membrane protein [Oscillospiraceae bacterium]